MNQHEPNNQFDISIRVGTFNLRNCARAHFQFYPNSEPYDERTYIAKRDWSALQIDKMNADVIVFEEVFHLDALQEILNTSKTMRGAKLIGRDAVSTPSKNGLIPQVAIATKLPLAREPFWLESYPDELHITPPNDEQPISMLTRAVPHITVRLPNDVNLHVLGVHLKSKRPDYRSFEDETNPNHLAIATYRSLIRRGADAVAIRHYLNGLLNRNQEPCIITGDFNDHANAVSTQIIAGTGRFGKSFYDFQLFDASRIQTKNDPQRYVAYSHIHEGSLEVLDHIFVSEEFHPDSRNKIALIRDVYCLNDHLHTRLPETSDHGQTVVNLLFQNQPTVA